MLNFVKSAKYMKKVAHHLYACYPHTWLHDLHYSIARRELTKSISLEFELIKIYLDV